VPDIAPAAVMVTSSRGRASGRIQPEPAKRDPAQLIGAAKMSGENQLPTAGHGSDNTDLYGGIALGVATIAALIVANSPLGPQYQALLQTTGEVRIGSIGLSKNLEHWINDGLMAIFFLLVGLEIKREAMQGALAGVKKAALPVIAAAGGFVLPAAIYAAINWSDSSALRGWAIPAATDIAFAIGVCAMLGRVVPASLKTFLLALAIIDDLLAIVVIAIFYTDDLSVPALALGGIGVAALAVLNFFDLRKPALYLVAGLFTWVCVLKSGVHATLAGVAVGFAMPLTKRDGQSMLEQTEHELRPWVSYAIVPIFAFANAGVPLHGVVFSDIMAPVPFGIIAGLFVGKQFGVFGASMVAIQLGLAALPQGASVAKLYAVAILTGIGFTMSLFIGTLAFDDEHALTQIRLGILVASLVSGLVAALLLAATGRLKSAPDT
jgi:NhaA family Na+:H+ antiporter